MPGVYRIVEHIVPCAHTREYPAATANGDFDSPVLAVKQYIPLDNPNPKPGDVTIIGAHANGIVKEMYEPLWEDLHDKAKQQGFSVRSIWINDIWNQGQSGILNENILGIDQSWFDGSRDMLNLINIKQSEMPQPIIAIGHSFGTAQLVQLSLMHPRLLRSLCLIEATVQSQADLIPLAAASTRRREIWPSRQAAADSFSQTKFYQVWDPRVFKLWIEYGLRDLPAEIYSGDVPGTVSGEMPVTLITTKHQEVVEYLRPTYRTNRRNFGLTPEEDKVHYADFDPKFHHDPPGHPFYRAEVSKFYQRLPELRPSVMWVNGSSSDFAPKQGWSEKVARTGTGIGGSGGSSAGRVETVTIPETGHFVALEKPKDCASRIASFIGKEMERWREEERIFTERWVNKSSREKAMVDQRWIQEIQYKNQPKL